MDLLKTYAHKVVSYLPAKQRDETFAEIYDELCEEYGDRLLQEPNLSQAEFLNATKMHPAKFATQLAESNSGYLIGPRFYFSFLSALRIAGSIVVVTYLILGIVAAMISGHYWSAIWGTLSDIPGTLLWVFAVILGIFVALERSGESATWLDNWDAGKMRPEDSHQQISQGNALFDLGISTVALLWIFEVVPFPGAVRHDGVWITDWLLGVPDWFWVALVIMFVFDIAFCLVRLSRTLWTTKLRLTTIVTNIIWIVLAGFAVAQPGLLTSASDAVPDLVPMLNNAVRGGLIVICLIIGWDTVSHLLQLRRTGFP